MTDDADRYLAFMGLAPKRIPHWEHWSCPDAETYLTGSTTTSIRSCAGRGCASSTRNSGCPSRKATIRSPGPSSISTGKSSTTDDQGRHHVRWGDGETGHWDWGDHFKSAEDVFAFSPLAQGDFTDIPVVESQDYSDEEKLYQKYRADYPAEWGDERARRLAASAGFYNTMFMWPLLTFGWELFLETCLDERFERIMDEFAEINRRVFRTFARLPVNFVVCHDDIVNSRGPVCSPALDAQVHLPPLRGVLGHREGGRQGGHLHVGRLHGRLRRRCDGLRRARHHQRAVHRLQGHRPAAQGLLPGRRRRQPRSDPRRSRPRSRRWCASMVETAQLTGGYMMCIGNHIPWNVPPRAIKRYLDRSAELALRV